jgi:predicted nucleotidyltransferase
VKHIPDEVKEVIDKHIEMIEKQLPNFLEAYYIYGSISLGSFNYGFSDIDFVVVAGREITDMDINILKVIHKEIKKKFPKTDLMGLYLMENDLQAQYESRKTSLCFIDGTYKGLQKFDKDSIDAYQLKKYGLTIKGKNIDNFNYEVNWDKLIFKMKDNLNSYWLGWVNSSKKIPSIKYISLFVSLKTIEWGVLGVSRLYYTFKEKDITSKVGAGEYALQKLPQKWHKIINESMRLRSGIKKSYYSSIFVRRNDALDYVNYIIQESNRLFSSEK